MTDTVTDDEIENTSNREAEDDVSSIYDSELDNNDIQYDRINNNDLAEYERANQANQDNDDRAGTESDDESVANFKTENIEETNTGSVSFGVGYSSLDSTSIAFGLNEKNFLGEGRRAKFEVSTSDLCSTCIRNNRILKAYVRQKQN